MFRASLLVFLGYSDQNGYHIIVHIVQAVTVRITREKNEMLMAKMLMELFLVLVGYYPMLLFFRILEELYHRFFRGKLA